MRPSAADRRTRSYRRVTRCPRYDQRSPADRARSTRAGSRQEQLPRGLPEPRRTRYPRVGGWLRHAVRIEVVVLSRDHQSLRLHQALLRIGRAVTEGRDGGPDRHDLLGQTGPLVSPGLADFHDPRLAPDIERQLAMRIPEFDAVIWPVSSNS